VANPLAEKVRELIVQRGPITFAEFMELALYDHEHGFYADPSRGPGFDYRTSPTLTPAFGKLLGRALVRMWRYLREPSEFTVIEVGAGRADLAAAAIEATTEEMPAALRWEFVERFSSVREIHAERLARSNAQISWRHSLSNGPPVLGCVLANEVLDNFPVHVFEVRDRKAAEVYVDVRDDFLVEKLGPPASEEMLEGVNALRHLEEGDRFEICPALEGWCADAGAALERGYLLVIDYGDTEPELWKKRPGGSVVTYERERFAADPLQNPGGADITAHVDFTRLKSAAMTAGFERSAVESQREFLKSLGFDDERDALRGANTRAQEEGNHAETLRLLAERSRLDAIVARGGLGDHVTFLGAKRASLGAWSQWRPPRSRRGKKGS
jgi:SAM-dependent MidA family methyltransferase